MKSQTETVKQNLSLWLQAGRARYRDDFSKLAFFSFQTRIAQRILFA
jgi:hypothetical protein